MTEPIAHHTSTTQPQPVLDDSAPPPRTGISGLRVALIAGVAAGTVWITRFRQVMRRDRRKPSIR